MSELRDRALALVRERGYERREQPFRLASGRLSHDYVDGKHAIDQGDSLLLVSKAIVELAQAREIIFNAVGGLTMGADALAHGICIAAGCSWFSVRKEPKPRGREQWIEGYRLSADDRVLLVDDVVTSGGSIRLAHEHVMATGATVAGVIPLVDRGTEGRLWFAEHGVPYAPLITYQDLEIEPVNGPSLTPTGG